jgi:hypothetical protein
MSVWLIEIEILFILQYIDSKSITKHGAFSNNFQVETLSETPSVCWPNQLPDFLKVSNTLRGTDMRLLK